MGTHDKKRLELVADGIRKNLYEADVRFQLARKYMAQALDNIAEGQKLVTETWKLGNTVNAMATRKEIQPGKGKRDGKAHKALEGGQRREGEAVSELRDGDDDE